MIGGTVADLAYTILATFDSLAYHLYNIKYKDYTFDCFGCTEIDENAIDATTTFKITYLGERNMNELEGYLYPNIVDGAGRGMLDDMCDFELKEIVEDTDRKGYSDYYVTPEYEKHEKYDYRKFNLKANNKKLKGLVLEIKNGYEVE